jgi:phosphonate transport system substrate-binding protein
MLFLTRVALFAALLVSSVSPAAPPPKSDPPAETAPLRFTAIPDQNATELKARYKPVSEYLARRLGIDVEYVAAADYQASVEMFKNGDVLLAWFGGLTGVQARAAVPGAHAIVQGAEDPHYYSYFIAHRSAGLTPSEQFPLAIASLPFAFGSESSTSGRLMPEYFLRRATGKSPAEFFEQAYGFSGSHTRTAELVCSGGRIKAGVINYLTWDSMVETGRVDSSDCQVLWKTPSYADYNMTAHPDIERLFGAGTTARLARALIAMDDPELLAAFARSGLIAASDGEFEGIARVARELGLLRDRGTAR